MAILFPAGLWPISVSFDLEMTSRSGGASITGSEQVVASHAGRWRASATFPMRTDYAVLNWRAFRASLDGRAGEFEVSPFDFYRPSDVVGHKVSGVNHARPTDDFAFADGAGWGQQDQTYAALSASAALGATRITVDATAEWMVPRPGQYFGIGDRLYIVTRYYRASSSGAWTVDFRPGLRAAATSGARVITDRPICLMRLAEDGSGNIELEHRQRGTASITMVEAF